MTRTPDTTGGEIASGQRLTDVVDRLLARGVAVRGELWLTVADVDLVFVGLDVLIASPEQLGRDRHGHPVVPEREKFQ